MEGDVQIDVATMPRIPSGGVSAQVYAPHAEAFDVDVACQCLRETLAPVELLGSSLPESFGVLPLQVIAAATGA